MISVMLARFVLVGTSALLLFAAAKCYGMPDPERPLELIAAYSVVSFAFLSLGLVIAMLANSTGAVQALGQCLFLPMIILGGVGVKLTTFPHEWMRAAAAFLPSNYAVCVMTECIVKKGVGLQSAQSHFDLVALTVIGLSCCLISVKLFRWEPEQKSTLTGKAWALAGLGVWVAVGCAAIYWQLNHAGRLTHLFTN